MIYELKVGGFKGSLKVKLFKMKERLSIFKNLNVKNTKDGVEFNSDSVDQFEKLTEMAKQRVESVDLVHIESGEKFNDFETIEYYSEYTEIVNEVIELLLNGAKLGKQRKKA